MHCIKHLVEANGQYHLDSLSFLQHPRLNCPFNTRPIKPIQNCHNRRFFSRLSMKVMYRRLRGIKQHCNTLFSCFFCIYDASREDVAKLNCDELATSSSHSSTVSRHPAISASLATSWTTLRTAKQAIGLTKYGQSKQFFNWLKVKTEPDSVGTERLSDVAHKRKRNYSSPSHPN